jgi:hypothetical protein
VVAVIDDDPLFQRLADAWARSVADNNQRGALAYTLRLAPCTLRLTPHYLTAYGLTGEPTPPVIGNAGATNMNS